jgi:integrase
MRKNLVPGMHRVRSNGKTYIYAFRGGPRLLAEPGSKAFLAEYLKATKHKEQPAETGTFSGLVADYRVSPEYLRLRPKSKRAYEPVLRALVDEYGTMPLVLMEQKGMRADFLRYRDIIAGRGNATADMHMAVLKAVMSWAVKRELLAVNKASSIEKLNQSTRRDRIWSEEECARLISTASPEMAHSFVLALNTGQRQGDLLRLTWTAYDGSTLSLRQSKTNASVRLRMTPDLKALLDAMPRKAVTILTNHQGRPWTERAFQSAFNRAKKKAGIVGLTFHDLRGTYISRAHALGYSISEIAQSSGHSERDAEKMIRKHYLAADVTSIRRER